MTKIDFYIAGSENASDANSHRLIACRIIEKAYRKNLSVYVHTDNEQDAADIDELLWSFRANSFIPHEMDNDAEEKNTDSAATLAPAVLISCSGNPRQHSDVLVNLSNQRPEFYGRFLRLAEIVSADDQSKTKSRERYKYFRDRGYPLNVHQL